MGEGVEDEQEARVQLTGVEQVGHPVTGSQARVDEAGAERGDELAPLLPGVAGEARGAGGAARLVDDGFGEGAVNTRLSCRVLAAQNAF